MPLTHPKAPSMATLACLQFALSTLRTTHHAVPAITHITRRNASHQAQGRANGAKDGAGKRLGAKKTGGEYVVPGNILFRQRGTHWFPGDNCFMGRDHTIHAGSPGYVRYYQDPARHPKRKFIGIVFEKTQSLPQPTHAARRRQLGMLAYQMPTPPQPETTPDEHSAAPTKSRDGTTVSIRNSKMNPGGLQLTLGPGYQYRQSNYEIGRSGDKKEAAANAKGKTIRAFAKFKPGDRFAAWRKSVVRVARSRERKVMGRGGKGGAKKKG
ncbi:54S ribosomal protein L2 mitochondrial [Friedmanniomyces endolithicus]|uniref:Large ribosomal subunit protein bL27m n=1 Tax=Friedmanniomyces endolithicus TaxID=329885 RepID=A0AAN6KD68_9PEZI|nr:54S ribosomal protein L2 mitochondrial [Friedmanniomyces endolithicus]KAK0296527.1 54S ribosomal protein L2 mitochondrial [Friedmanniomyces endolithicus]KAK0309839.1 54S ribosomal protein L2 mitochondrial [Friedmanniomyces endolithicus]KAK0324514.1 54S ribosomal protein L2 mitochondrial [Friedmanniomyces endolithicus]KAK0931988.1 54S ribosomal protein L2 mitochondrial [Friedmanniomyces endolithicus]